MRADARGRADTILLHTTHIATLRAGIVNDITKVGHAQNIYYQRIVL